MGKLMDGICRWIPRNVGNRLILSCLELLRCLDRVRPRSMKKRAIRAIREVKAHDPGRREGFIEDQHAYADVHYGRATMAYSGCEVIAVYNALRSLEGDKASTLPSLMTHFERDGILLNGLAGTSPRALERFFKRRGYSTQMSTNPMDFFAMGKRFPVFVFTFYNNGGDVRDEIHTICITRDRGLFTGHNIACNGTVGRPCTTIGELLATINGGKAAAISLIGIQK